MPESVAMILGLFLIGYAVHGFILAMLVWSLEHLPGRLKLRAPAWRELLWRTVLLAPLFTTVFQLQTNWRPLLGVITANPIVAVQSSELSPIIVSDTAVTDSGQLAGSESMPLPIRFQRTGENVGQANINASQNNSPTPLLPAMEPFSGNSTRPEFKSELSVFPLLALSWLLITVLLLVKLKRQVGELQGLRRAAISITDPSLEVMLEKLAVRAGLKKPVLISHPAVQGPATLPWQVVCLPGWVAELSPTRQQALLAHELGHIKRADVAWLGLGAVLQTLFWPQLLLPLVRRKLRVLAELQADSFARGLLNNNGRELAGCLTDCAQRLHDQFIPGLAVAMSHPTKQPAGNLTERVQLLISPTPLLTEVCMYKKAVLIVSVIALGLVLPAVNVQAEKASPHSSVYEVIDDDGYQTIKLSLSDGDHRLKLRAEGEIEFMPDDGGIQSMGEGAEFTLTEQRAGLHRRLEASGQAGGGIDYEYSIDNDQQPFDSEARVWLAESLPRLLAESGINAENRIAYLLDSEGHDGVVNRIHKISNSHSLSKHIEAYTSAALLEDDELDDVLLEARRIGSDYNRRKALVTINEHQSGSADDDRQHVVINKHRVRKIVDASEGIGSDFELRNLLQSIGEGVDDVDVHRSILRRAGDIDSDFELRETLSWMATAAAQDQQVAELWLETAGQLDSDFELRQALEQLAHQYPENENTWVAMLQLAERFDSDFECATFLNTAAANMPRTREIEAAYQQVLETIDSDYERQRARRALG